MFRKLLSKGLLHPVAAGLLAGGILLIAHSLMVPAKAFLSPILLERAWENTLKGRRNVRPWPWMDGTVIAKIRFPEKDRTFVVLDGSSGTALAFAPGWHNRTARPGDPGTTVISAHRDTHFRLLQNLDRGDEIRLQDSSGKWHEYTVSDYFVTDRPEMGIAADSDLNTLVLVTCYPFDALAAGGQQRFVMIASEKTDTSS
jgi:sortase A